jgi:hypothetical protein
VEGSVVVLVYCKCRVYSVFSLKVSGIPGS